MRYRKDNSPRTITVKYAGKCARCDVTIPAGTRARYWPDTRKIAHIEPMQCIFEVGSRDPGFVDLDRMYEDQCSDICGR